jgi:hypothetical protein
MGRRADGLQILGGEVVSLCVPIWTEADINQNAIRLCHPMCVIFRNIRAGIINLFRVS